MEGTFVNVRPLQNAVIASISEAISSGSSRDHEIATLKFAGDICWFIRSVSVAISWDL